MSDHPFDQAIALQPSGGDRMVGQTHPAYANMVGPYGGITAAVMLNAVLQHPQRLGDPLALTVNFAAAVAPGGFDITARPACTNRSTQHWVLELTQPDAQGQPAVVGTGTAVTAVARDTWASNDTPMPQVPSAAHTLRQQLGFSVEWVKRYDMRPCEGMLPSHWDGSGSSSLTRQWVRDDPPRPLDVAALTAMADVFYPRVWLRRAKLVPAGTVSFSVYIHADAATLAAVGERHLLVQAQAQAFHKGFFDQTAQLWSPDGDLLAVSHQLVYYKE